MDAFISLALFATIVVGWTYLLGLPALSAAYPDRAARPAKKVGWFGVKRSRWNPWSAGFVRVSASSDGLILQSIWPLWWRPLFIPWSDLWIANIRSAVSPRIRIGFQRCPGVSFLVTGFLVPKVQKSIAMQIPSECFV